MEPGERGDFQLLFIAGPGTYTQTLRFFLDANGALHERTLDVMGQAHAPPTAATPGNESESQPPPNDQQAGN